MSIFQGKTKLSSDNCFNDFCSKIVCVFFSIRSEEKILIKLQHIFFNVALQFFQSALKKKYKLIKN